MCASQQILTIIEHPGIYDTIKKKKRFLPSFVVSFVNVAFTVFTSQSGHTNVFPKVLSSTGGAIVIRMAYLQLLLADFRP